MDILLAKDRESSIITAYKLCALIKSNSLQNLSGPFMQNKLQTEVFQLLEEAGKFAQQGKREKAYQASLRATTVAPDEPLAWYARSQSASSTEEQLMCLSRAYSLNPHDAETKKELHTAVHTLLKQ